MEWGAYDIFSAVDEREKLIFALQQLLFLDPEAHTAKDWCKRVLDGDDACAFDWIEWTDAPRRVLKDFHAEFKLWQARYLSSTKRHLYLCTAMRV
jgi:hypothetical protein